MKYAVLIFNILAFAISLALAVSGFLLFIFYSEDFSLPAWLGFLVYMLFGNFTIDFFNEIKRCLTN